MDDAVFNLIQLHAVQKIIPDERIIVDADELEKAILDQIAIENNLARKTVHIGPNDAIYYIQGGMLLCDCTKDSAYWFEVTSKVATDILIRQVMRA